MKPLHVVSLPALLQTRARVHAEEAQRLVALALKNLDAGEYRVEFELAERNLQDAAAYLEPAAAEPIKTPVLRVVK